MANLLKTNDLNVLGQPGPGSRYDEAERRNEMPHIRTAVSREMDCFY